MWYFAFSFFLWCQIGKKSFLSNQTEGFSRAHCMNLVDYYWFRAWKIKILVQQSFSNRPLIQSRTIDFGSYYWFRTYSYLYNEVISCFIAPPIIWTMHLAATCRFCGKGIKYRGPILRVTWPAIVSNDLNLD